MRAGRQPVAGRVCLWLPAVGRAASAPVRMFAFPRIDAAAVSSARTPAPAFNGSWWSHPCSLKPNMEHCRGQKVPAGVSNSVGC
jgi:hypothetical protein